MSYNDISSELPFMAMYSLESLNLTGNPLTDEQVELIRKNLPNCDVIFCIRVILRVPSLRRGLRFICFGSAQ